MAFQWHFAGTPRAVPGMPPPRPLSLMGPPRPASLMGDVTFNDRRAISHYASIATTLVPQQLADNDLDLHRPRRPDAPHQATAPAPRWALTAEAVSKRARSDGDPARERAMESMVSLIKDYMMALPMVQTILDEEGGLSSSSPSLAAAFYKKKTATMVKRVGSLLQYRAWFRTTGRSPEVFLTEGAVYKYFEHLHFDRAPATRAQALREAVHFLCGTLRVPVEDISKSPRVQGLCCKLLRTRAAVRQRTPLSVKMVQALEKTLVSGAAEGAPSAILAGGLLFTLFSRARVGDMRKCPIQPEGDLSNVKKGYVSTRFLDHKTARPGDRRALPIIAPATGIFERSWGAAYLEARAVAKLDAAQSGTVLPAIGPDGQFSSVAYTTPEVAAVLRHLLLDAGFTPAELEGIGSHSLKATCLAWAARHGVSRDSRRLLGYHAHPTDKTIDSYGRDVMAGPLRDLEAVLEDIRSGKFLPDCTRSGAFVEVLPCNAGSSASSAPAQPATEVPDKQAEEDADDVEVQSATSASVASTSSAGISDDELELSPQTDAEVKTVAINRRTGYAHLLGEDGRLVCGKATPKGCQWLAAVPAGTTLCSRCF